MKTRIGTCSICGGDVMDHVGAWGSITPPPPATCNKCGAINKNDVIQMYPSKRILREVNPTTDSAGNIIKK